MSATRLIFSVYHTKPIVLFGGIRLFLFLAWEEKSGNGEDYGMNTQNEKKKPLSPGVRLIQLLKKHSWNEAVRILKKEQAVKHCSLSEGKGKRYE